MAVRSRRDDPLMRLRDALDLCSDRRVDDWVEIPGERPATAMVAGMFDPGVADDARTRPLAGHSFAVYEPDARLSLVWPVPEDDDHLRPRGDSWIPEWAESDKHQWKSARSGWAVVLLGGAPIWQDRLWYLDWGSGIGGYVPDFDPVYTDIEGPNGPQLEAWQSLSWAVELARLINFFSASSDWFSFDPTLRIVPSPLSQHPVDAARAGG